MAVAETPDGAPQKQRSRPEPAPEDLELARLLAKRIRENNPSAKITAAQGPEWANECRLMRERDGRTSEQIRQHIDWAQRDAFWRLNCLSMGAVRKHWDRNALAMADAASARDETPGYRRLDSDEARREVGLL